MFYNLLGNLINFVSKSFAMSELKMVCQNHSLVREPTPCKNRIEERWHPEESICGLINWLKTVIEGRD
jgi:hypothetical protein